MPHLPDTGGLLLIQPELFPTSVKETRTQALVKGAGTARAATAATASVDPVGVGAPSAGVQAISGNGGPRHKAPSFFDKGGNEYKRGLACTAVGRPASEGEQRGTLGQTGLGSEPA